MFANQYAYCEYLYLFDLSITSHLDSLPPGPEKDWVSARYYEITLHEAEQLGYTATVKWLKRLGR
jgi:acetylornithine deacetylase/succinyl-diaminopimelate desuccinylase-like protein